MPHLPETFVSGIFLSADMAELADAPDLGSGVYDVQVQLLLSALFSALCKYLFTKSCFYVIL